MKLIMENKCSAKQKAYFEKWYQINKEDQKAKKKAEYQINKEDHKARKKAKYAHIKACVVMMISSQVMSDPLIWHYYCVKIRQSARKNPYPEDFTNDMMFDKMKDGCMYCGGIATTIDRIVSNLDHISDNCIGCCFSCNMAKGNSDPDTFIRKAYYRIHGEYFDNDSDIWSDNKRRPQYSIAKTKSQKQNRNFTLTQQDWNALISGDCAYCKRARPDNKWNGVDRFIPTEGYTLENTVSCCDDCNVDKWEFSAEETRKRNDKIANRIANGQIIFFGSKANLRNKGIKSSAKKVCAYGNVYSSQQEASCALNKNELYVAQCIYYKRYLHDIFHISDEFYNKYKDYAEYITKEMFDAF